jgi:uncharacterized protein (TIGR03437 family)
MYNHSYKRMNRFLFSQCPLLAATLFAIGPALARKTTSINVVNVSGMTQMAIVRPVSLSGTGTISPFGSAAVSFSGSQDQKTFLTQGTFTLSLNRLDSFNVTASPQSINKMTTLNLPGPIVGGTGAFSGATGSVTYTFKYTGNSANAGTFTLTGSGNITVGATTTAITLGNFNGAAFVASAANGTLQASPTGTVAPFGDVTVNFNGVGSRSGAAGAVQGELTFVFDANDSFIASFSAPFSFNSASNSLPCIITGGTGEFSGATGSLTANFAVSPNDTTFTLNGAGTITQPPPGTPVITSVITAFGGPAIAQNTWIQINGNNLVPSNTPAAGVVWNNALSFAAGMLPTQLNGIGATVNGKPAFVSFFCSAATSSVCTTDQINVLTPLDSFTGPAQIVVTSGATSSSPVTATMQAISPAFLLFSTKGYVVASHADYSLLGPTSLFPGSTPAKAPETVAVYGVGFGLPATAVVNGSSTQSGVLSNPVTCTLGGVPVAVPFAGLISPGLYQLNIAIPATAPSGDNSIVCTYSGISTLAGLIAVQ